jgi:hypothetical protein
MRTEEEDASIPEKETTGILSVSGVNFELQCDEDLQKVRQR